MLDLWLVRHAESLGNLDGSEADTCLSPRGQLQAAALAPVLAGESFDSVLSSPLQRALETAALALPGRACSTRPTSASSSCSPTVSSTSRGSRPLSCETSFDRPRTCRSSRRANSS
ncbi:histidine phosphatase family protein [Nannocystis sp. ILAH1]|uniref:histidine phosphatase family protein n=1 Tax=Nannocystis sp. ILAH1 TaxID=2996789 RepID=UPI0032082F1F